jgi:hypothetical protein
MTRKGIETAEKIDKGYRIVMWILGVTAVGILGVIVCIGVLLWDMQHDPVLHPELRRSTLPLPPAPEGQK